MDLVWNGSLHGSARQRILRIRSRSREHCCGSDHNVMDMTIQVQVIISGKVQGVWFRASTKKKAEELGLMGWVKNVPDGSVEAVFEGDPSKVDEMIAWCWIGPPLARVSDVKVTRRESSGRFTKFSFLYK
jgi:acylphosphatase